MVPYLVGKTQDPDNKMLKCTVRHPKLHRQHNTDFFRSPNCLACSLRHQILKVEDVSITEQVCQPWLSDVMRSRPGATRASERAEAMDLPLLGTTIGRIFLSQPQPRPVLELLGVL